MVNWCACSSPTNLQLEVRPKTEPQVADVISCRSIRIIDINHRAPTGLRERRSATSPEITAKLDFRGTTDINNDVIQIGNSIADDVKIAASNGLQLELKKRQSATQKNSFDNF